jgi:hypothetical protein
LQVDEIVIIEGADVSSGAIERTRSRGRALRAALSKRRVMAPID